MTEALIDKTVQNYFIEYLKEDLSEYKIQDKSQSEKNKPKGGLLNGDEKVGLERLIECMHCCMWSNMKKKK